MAAPKWKTSPCRGCGAPIVWAEDDAGKRHPLDPKAPTFLAVADARSTHAKRMPDVLVSHFATCPKASQFSGKGRKAKASTSSPLTAGEEHALAAEGESVVAEADARRHAFGGFERHDLEAMATSSMDPTVRRLAAALLRKKDADPAAMLVPVAPDEEHPEARARMHPLRPGRCDRHHNIW